MKKAIKTMALLLAVIFTVSISLAGCAGKQESAGGSSAQSAALTQTQAGTEAAPEKVTLKLYGPATGYSLTDGVQDDPVSKEIQRVTGVTIDLDAHPDDAKFNAMLASGDLPDLLVVDKTSAQTAPDIVKTMLQGNMLLPLDDLIQTDGPDISKLGKILDFDRKYYSNGDGKLYAVQGYIDPTPAKGSDSGIGPLLRWDYYAELGYPQLKSRDDWLKLVSDMLAKHPTTDDGKKRYGFSLFFEWGWLAAFQHTGDICKSLEGQSIVTGRAGFTEYDMEKDTVRSSVASEDSALWEAVEFYYKANKMKLLDPDTFTNKWDNVVQKATDDRVLSSMWNWAYGDINKKLNPEGKGYEIVPMNSKVFAEGTASPMGVSYRLWTIPKASSNPGAAMRLMNYLFSAEGARTVLSGILGTNYVEKDGKLVIPPSEVDKQKTDTNWTINTGIKKYNNFSGLGPDFVDPQYNLPVSLWSDTTHYEVPVDLNPFEKAYCEHYGIANMVDKYAYLEKSTFNGTITSVLSTAPDEIKAIDKGINDYLGVELPKLLIAKTDEAFAAGKKAIIAECRQKGLDKSDAFWLQAQNQAITEAKQYQ